MGIRTFLYLAPSPGLSPLRRPLLVYPARLPLFHPSTNTLSSAPLIRRTSHLIHLWNFHSLP